MHDSTFLTAGKVQRQSVGLQKQGRFMDTYLLLILDTMIGTMLILMLPQMSFVYIMLPHQKCHNPPALATYDLCHRIKSLHHLNLRAIMS
jgi:hypothetical protein